MYKKFSSFIEHKSFFFFQKVGAYIYFTASVVQDKRYILSKCIQETHFIVKNKKSLFDSLMENKYIIINRARKPLNGLLTDYQVIIQQNWNQLGKNLNVTFNLQKEPLVTFLGSVLKICVFQIPWEVILTTFSLWWTKLTLAE